MNTTTNSANMMSQPVPHSSSAPTGHIAAAGNAQHLIQPLATPRISTTTTGELELKMRVPNQLIGRLIGKSGSSVKQLMHDTMTNISVRWARGCISGCTCAKASVYEAMNVFQRLRNLPHLLAL